MNKVLLLVPCIQYGGTETVAIRYYKELTNNNIVVDLLSIVSSKNLPKNTKYIFNEKSYIYKILTKKLLRPIFYLVVFLNYIKPTFNCNTIICFGELPIFCNFLNVFFYKKFLNLRSKKFISSFRNHPSTISKKKQNLLVKVFNSFDLNTTNSSIATNFLKERFNLKNIQTLYNPLPIEEKPLCKQLDISSTINLLSVSRLEKQKNIHLLIKSFHQIQLNSNCPYTFKLHIIGYGSQHRVLVNYVKKNNLKNNITFYGKLSQEEVMKMYKFADFFVHCSKWDGIPNTVLESLYFNLPVIAYSSKISGIIDLMNFGAPISLFNTESEYDLSNEIISYVRDFNVNRFNKKNQIFINNYRKKSSILNLIDLK